MQANPDQLIDGVAGYYIPDMHEVNGFGLPANLKKLRAGLLKQGFDKSVAIVAQLKMKEPTFQLNETELNAWGYQLLSQKNIPAALSIFKLNVALYPGSANAFASLAEAYEITDNQSEALKNYKKSLALNPKNKNAADRIKALTK